MKIDLTPDEMNNLRVFLDRVQLTGKEVPAFIVIQNKIATAVIGTGKEDVKDE